MDNSDYIDIFKPCAIPKNMFFKKNNNYCDKRVELDSEFIILNNKFNNLVNNYFSLLKKETLVDTLKIDFLRIFKIYLIDLKKYNVSLKKFNSEFTF